VGAVGARAVADDGDGAVGVALVVVINGAVGVEELVGDVGQDGGVARGDAALGDEGEEMGYIVLVRTRKSRGWRSEVKD
jgi:hypothetical protein